MAFHAGTLLALELHGFTPRDAVSITGTSAGSVVTAVLAAGGEVEDLAAHAVGAIPRESFRDIDRLARDAERGALRLDVSSLVQVADLRRAVRALGHLRARRVASAVAAMVPGVVAIAHRFRFLDQLAPTTTFPPWRIVAADATGRRHVLTAALAPLSLAVAASCAVPGVFAPVRHNGRRLVDGGLHSTTNADLAGSDDASTVIVLAPMCGRDSRDGSIQDLATVALGREVAELEARGKRVVTFRPPSELQRLMGWNPFSTRRSRDITAGAFLAAADVLTELSPRRRAANRPPVPAAVSRLPRTVVPATIGA
jgi:NTE family protein